MMTSPIRKNVPMAVLLTLGSIAILAMATETPKEEPKKTAAQLAFDRLKTLEGQWKGTATHGDEEIVEAQVNYRVTAAGSAVLETLFVGAPHEMLTVYHLDGDDLVLTHYCALGNQPTMKLIKSPGPNTFAFKCTGVMNVNSENDPHMHAVSHKLLDSDHIKSEWTLFKEGQPAHTAKLDFHRSK